MKIHLLNGLEMREQLKEKAYKGRMLRVKEVFMEEIKDREYFKKLANQLMFDLSDEEADELVGEFSTLEAQMKLLDAVDTEGVEEMVYPFETPTTFLREDKVSNVISQDDAMANVKKKLEGHFVLPKVVK